MKALIVLTAFIINSTIPAFGFIVDQSQMNSNWDYSPLIKRTQDKSELQFKIFKRSMWINNTEVPLVETTFTYLKNPQGKTDLKNLAATIQKSLDKNKLKVSTTNNSYKIEGPFTRINRQVKIDLKLVHNDILIITSFIRLGFLKNVKSEVDDLHAILLSYNGESLDKKTSWIKWLQTFVIKDAYADGLNVLNLLGGSNTTMGTIPNLSLDTSGIQNSIDTLNNNVGTANQNWAITNGQLGNTNIQLGNANANWSNTNTQLGNANTQLGNANANWSNTNTQLGNVNTQLGNVNTQLGNVNTQLGNANTNWAGTNARLGDTNTQLGNANTNWAGTNARLGDTNTQFGNANTNWAGTNARLGDTNTQLGNANANWGNTNTQIDKANVNLANFNKEFGNMNTNWAESNKLMAQMLDPNHMAKVAFYTAAGAALGAVTVNLAVQGVSSGISFLYELFTGANKKKLEWEDLEKAMAVWDNQLNDLVKMEQAVDSYLAAFEFFDGKNLTNDYVKQLSDAMRDMRFDRDLFMEKFKDQKLETGCRKLYYNAADELDQKLKEYDQILQYSTKNSGNVASGPNYFCNQLKELQRKILSAENQMQDLRLKILLAENQFYEKQGYGLENRDDKMDNINDHLDRTLQEKKKYDDKVIERLAESQKANKAEWIEACLDGKNEQGKLINKEHKGFFFGIFTHFKRKDLCSTEYDKIAKDIMTRDDKSIATITTEEQFRKDLKLKSNNYVDMKLSEEQMSWMARLHTDAYCFQYAHQASDKIPKKCQEFPELLYSMNLSKGYDKAKKAYDDKCQDRYLKGLRNLATTESK